MSRLREIAKFASGWEAFHAVAHIYFWSADMTLAFLGITITPTVSLAGAVLNAAIALLLGLYAWGYSAAMPGGGPTARAPAA
jgi:hypothetical protein